MKKLIFFTESYPFGIGEEWKTNELKHLIKCFDEILIIPNNFGSNFNSPKSVADNVRCEKPLFIDDNVKITYLSLFQLIDKNILYYLNEFVTKKVYKKKTWIISWLIASLKAKRLLKHKTIVNVFCNIDKKTLLYFFWGKGTCEVLPLIPYKDIVTVVRLHRYDLYEDQNDNYIPYRKQLYEKITYLVPCSQNGVDYVRSIYPQVVNKLKLFRLGALSAGRNTTTNDGIFKMVSCSSLVAVKRVDLIVNALKLLQIQVIWVHLGNGPLMSEIKIIASELPSNVHATFLGHIDSSSILSYYTNNPFDLFINVSSSEGVPVSIMEALSAGIPIIATNVGGTGEIVDDSVGKLLPGDVTPEMIAQEISKLSEMTPLDRNKLRENAYARYHERCNVNILGAQFMQFLSRLI